MSGSFFLGDKIPFFGVCVLKKQSKKQQCFMDNLSVLKGWRDKTASEMLKIASLLLFTAHWDNCDV